MTFHPNGACGVYDSDDLATLTYVFDTVSGCRWFYNSDDCREQFATYLLRRYGNGLRDPQALKVDCVALASARFSSDRAQPDQAAISQNHRSRRPVSP
jgi:hypothetical protein